MTVAPTLRRTVGESRKGMLEVRLLPSRLA